MPRLENEPAAPAVQLARGRGVADVRENQDGRAASRRLRDWANAVGERLAWWIERHEALTVAAVLAATLAVILRMAMRPMWFDEMLTFYIARQGSVREIVQSIHGDGNPPLIYLLAGASLRLVPNTELALRIPSMGGFMLAMVTAYLFVRRRLGVVAAVFALLALGTSPAVYFGSEARPYALLLGFTGLALVSWQAAVGADGRGRMAALAGVAIGVAGAVSSHYYGVFHVGAPLLCGEAVRLVRRRKPDWPLYLACAAGLTMLLTLIPFARVTYQLTGVYVRQSANFWAKPELSDVVSYFGVIGWWVPVIACAVLWAIPRGGEKRWGLPIHETAAVVGLTLLVVIMMAITRVTSGYFQERYAIGSAIGAAILAPAWLAFEAGGARRAAVCAALCVPLLVAAGAARVDFGGSTVVNGRRVGNSARVLVNLERVEGTEPIVVASALSYLPIWWYGSETLRARLHYLADVPYAVRQPAFLAELCVVAERNCVPSKADDFRQFVSSHHSFLLYCIDDPRLEWTKDRLAKEGWILTPIRSGQADTLYRAGAPSSLARSSDPR